jgi:hypothetical protein
LLWVADYSESWTISSGRGGRKRSERNLACRLLYAHRDFPYLLPCNRLWLVILISLLFRGLLNSYAPKKAFKIPLFSLFAAE